MPLRSDASGLVPLDAPQLYEQIQERIMLAILDGTFRVGERLPSERDLAKSLAVGRPSVREALASLQLAGVVGIRAGSGSVVSVDAFDRISTLRLRLHEDARTDASPFAVLEARTLFEPAVARLAARLGRRDSLIEEELSRQEAVTDPGDPVQAAIWSESDRIFHRQIAVISRNPLLISLYDYVAAIMTQPLWRVLRERITSAREQIVLYAEQHAQIYAAIRARDEEGAAYFSLEHIRRVTRAMEEEHDA